MLDKDSIREQFAMNVIAWAYKWGHLAITSTVRWVPTVHSEAKQATIVSFSLCLMFVALLSNPIDSFIEDLVVVAVVLLKVFVVFAGMMLLLALPLLVCIIACKVAGLRRMPPVHAAGARSWIYCHFPFSLQP
jgi:hypothetical protein